MSFRKPVTVLLFISLVIAITLIPSTWQKAAAVQKQDRQALLNERLYNEQQTVYLTNLKRAVHGVPPLRWNQQLTLAARWFSQDAVERNYCGHQDSNGQWPDDRARIFGYYGFAGAENAFCGNVSPEQAVNGWYNEVPPDDGHRRNMLDPNSWEVGIGYYMDGPSGYVTQNFGHDAAYPPVVIDNEAIQTPDPAVDLYIYSSESNNGIGGLGPATEMMISNDPCFTGATWQPYNAHQSWSLTPGEGWRTVYVKSRDASGRTIVVKDTIYLGAAVPYPELDLIHASTRSGLVNLRDLDGAGLPSMQFSLNWLAEMEKGKLWWGNGEVVSDVAASAGQAYRLRPGSGNSFMWITPQDYPRDLPSQAYLRLKVDDNSTHNPVARISVETNGVKRDELELKGTDFDQAGLYQEFPLDFVQDEDAADPWLTIGVERLGTATIHADRVMAFTAPEPVQSNIIWPVPGSNYRGQSIWVRYTDNAGTFSAVSEATATQVRLQTSSAFLSFWGTNSAIPPAQTVRLSLEDGCGLPTWALSGDRSWLKFDFSFPDLQVWVDPSGLSPGIHQALLTIDAGPDILQSPKTIPVQFTLVDQQNSVSLPLIIK